MDRRELRIGKWIKKEGEYFKLKTAMDLINALYGINELYEPILLDEQFLDFIELSDIKLDADINRLESIKVYRNGELVIFSSDLGHIEVNTLHQLQNIYFDFTHEDLNFNENILLNRKTK